MPKEIFINISNHPISKWGEAQRQAAGLLSGVEGIVEGIDIAFPNVPPTLDDRGLVALASDMLAKVRAVGEPQEDEDCPGVWAVHVMGEQGLTWLLVMGLKDDGYNVVHSTTERITEEKDGQKVVTFCFVRFRAYPMGVGLETKRFHAMQMAKAAAWGANAE